MTIGIDKANNAHRNEGYNQVMMIKAKIGEVGLKCKIQEIAQKMRVAFETAPDGSGSAEDLGQELFFTYKAAW